MTTPPPAARSAVNARSARALIADDERLMREQLRARLAEVWPELEIVAEAKNGLEAVQLTEAHHPDLVFLDIRMPGMTGVEAARAIAQLPVDEDNPDGWSGCEVVFITAYDQYAVEAFEQGVVDYVLKPAERERLLVTVERIRKRLAQRRSDEGPAATGMQHATLEALIRKPIKELVDELDAEIFWQIHRSTLVNTRFIASVTRDLSGRQRVGVKGHPEKLEVSRSYAGLFKGM
jgi:DNA-binding LytR/AlgR family response regulator